MSALLGGGLMLKFLCLQEEGKTKKGRENLGQNVEWKVSSTTPAQVTHKLSENYLLNYLAIHILLTVSGTGKSG